MDEDAEIVVQNFDGPQTEEQCQEAMKWEKHKLMGLTNARLDYALQVKSQKRNALLALYELAKKLGKEADFKPNRYGLNIKKDD